MSSPTPNVDLPFLENGEDVFIADDGPSPVLPRAPGDFNLPLVTHGSVVNVEVCALLMKMLSMKLNTITVADTPDNRRQTLQAVDLLVGIGP